MSRFNEPGSRGTREAPRVSCGPRGCRGSGQCAPPKDTALASAKAHRGNPRPASFAGWSPKDGCRAGRKRPSSRPRPDDGSRGPAVVSARGCETNLRQAQDESPGDRTRRRRSSGRRLRDGARSGGSSFFRSQLRIVALFAGLDPPQLDLVGAQDLPQRLQADRPDDLLLHQVVTQLGQRPAGEGAAQQVRRTQGRLHDEAALLLGELARGPVAESGEPTMRSPLR